jgi:hypothetical protein
LTRLRAGGADAECDLGDAEPLTVIADALIQPPFDEIIISTLPSGSSRWLGMDLPPQRGAAVQVPVTLKHVQRITGRLTRATPRPMAVTALSHSRVCGSRLRDGFGISPATPPE